MKNKFSKKSIVLLATLFFVMLMISLVGVNTKLLNRSFQIANNAKFMIQINSLLKDIQVLVESKAGLVKDEKTLAVILSKDWNITDPKTSLKIHMRLDSFAKTFNINRLRPRNNQSQSLQVYDVFRDMLMRLDVQDPEYLIDLILDTRDKDLQERSYESEIAFKDYNFEQGKIYSKAHFDRILSSYKKRTDDYIVDDIPWSDLIGFDGYEIDINHASSKFIATVLDRPVDEIKMLLQENKPIADINATFDQPETALLQLMGAKPFVPLVKASINFEVFEKVAQASFAYNLKDKTAHNVNISSKY